MRKVTRPIALLMITVAAALGLDARIVSADDLIKSPVGWRGDGSGQYPSADPPTKWSAKENIIWKAEVGMGTSSPVLVGQRLFITAEPNLLICLDAGTGKELWRKAHKIADFTTKNAGT